jgi:hypothetical protein
VAIAWTAALAGALHGTDRLLLGARTTAWTPAAAMEAAPAELGELPTPGYLPDTLDWPPRVVVYRTGNRPGYWLGVAARDQDRIRLWVGHGDDPLPDGMAVLSACLASATGTRCPTGWHALAIDRGGQPLHVLGDLEGREMRRILIGIEELSPRP